MTDHDIGDRTTGWNLVLAKVLGFWSCDSRRRVPTGDTSLEYLDLDAAAIQCRAELHMAGKMLVMRDLSSDFHLNSVAVSPNIARRKLLLDETLVGGHSTLGTGHVILPSGNSNRVDACSSTLMIVPSDRNLHWMF
jgi:hypothetical protein